VSTSNALEIKKQSDSAMIAVDMVLRRYDLLRNISLMSNKQPVAGQSQLMVPVE
jgi:hypothetical protein